MIYESIFLSLAIVVAMNRYCQMREYIHQYSKNYEA